MSKKYLLDQKYAPHGECAACDKPATHGKRVENGYMQGDADVFKVCEKHLGQLLAGHDKIFYKSVNNKDD